MATYEPTLIGVHFSIGWNIPKKYKKMNFELIKVGDTIRLFNNERIEIKVDTTNIYETLTKIKNEFERKFRKDMIKEYICCKGGTLKHQVYEMISSYLDSDQRRQLANKFEDGKELTLLELCGDVDRFEGFYQVSQNVWSVAWTN